MSIAPIVSLFKEQLENESTTLTDQYGLEKRGDLLIWWYFLRIADLDEAEIPEIICDGGNDLGIDAIWIDDTNLVHFYQFKNPEMADRMFPDGDIDKTLSGLQLILSRRYDEIANDELRGRVEEIYQNVRQGYRLHIVSSGAGLTRESGIKLDDFSTGLEGPSDDFFIWEDVNIAKLQDQFYKSSLPTVEDPIVLNLDQTPYAVRSADHDSYICHLSGEGLASLYEEHGEQLLQQNIRVYEGDKATNNSIRQTCTSDDSGNFLHFNNGITFLCDTASWDAFARTLTLIRAQIVNGGQTARVLHSALQRNDLKADVKTVVRIITSSGDKGFANSVAVNLNNQNRITASFLRSNDPRVIQLSNSLSSIGVYLERRPKEVKGFTEQERANVESRIGQSLENNIIKLKEGTQAYTATFIRRPELAKKNLKLMFVSSSDGGHFDRIFNSDLTAEKFTQAHRIACYVNNFVKEFMKRKRRKERVARWEDDYAELLSAEIVERHGSLLDQIVPQSAIFLLAVVFEEERVIKGIDVEELISTLADSGPELFSKTIDLAITYATTDPQWEQSWPTLLKSQSFFEKYSAYRRGEIQQGTENNEG